MPWIVTVSVLHGVRDVLFPRSCFLTRNRFSSFVKWLDDILKITVGYKCTCADDTRTTTTTEILKIQTDTYEMSAHFFHFLVFFMFSIFCFLFFFDFLIVFDFLSFFAS